MKLPVMSCSIPCEREWSARPVNGAGAAIARQQASRHRRWLDSQPILVLCHPSSPLLAAAEYRRFVAAATAQTPSPWENLVAQAFLGSAEFLRRIEERVREEEHSREHPRAQRNIRTTSLDGLRAAVECHSAEEWPPAPGSPARLAFALLAARHTNATHAAIGAALGITGQAVGKLLRVGSQRARRDDDLMELVARVEANVRHGDDVPFRQE